MDEVAVGVVVVLWTVAIVEVVRALRGTGARSLAVAVLALSVGRTIDLEPVSEALGRTALLGVVEHAVVLTSAVAVVVFTRRITPESGAQAWRTAARGTGLPPMLLVGAVAVAVTALLLPLAYAGEVLPDSANARGAVYAADPRWIAHWAVFLVALGITLMQGGNIALRNARHARGVLRIRLYGLGIGQRIGVIYVLLKAGRLAMLAQSPEFASRDEVLAALEQVSLTACLAVIASGLVAGAVAAATDTGRTRLRVWALWPVWVALWDHAPHMPYTSPPSRVRSVLSADVRMILVRQVVELGDAIRVLTPYMPTHDSADPQERARALSTAAARRAAGHQPAADHRPRTGKEGVTVDERIARLLPIARRWHRGHTHETARPEAGPERAMR